MRHPHRTLPRIPARSLPALILAAAAAAAEIPLPAPRWQLDPGAAGNRVEADGDGLVVTRAVPDAEERITRAFADLPAQEHGQYLLRYRVETQQAASACWHHGTDASWNDKARPCAQTHGSRSVAAPITLPGGATRLRVNLTADTPGTSARFTDMRLEEANPARPLAVVNGNVAIDGRPDEPLWTQATVLAPFRVLGDIGAQALLADEARAAVQDGWLLISGRFPEPDVDALRATDDMFSGDCVEVFLSFDRSEYIHLGIDPRGRRQAELRGRALSGAWWYEMDEGVFQGEWSAAAATDRSGRAWTWELRLRLASLGHAPLAGRIPLHLNVVRHRGRGDQPYTTWALLPQASNHEPSAFGTVILDLPPALPIPSEARPLVVTRSLEVPELLFAGKPLAVRTGSARVPLPGELAVEDAAGAGPEAAALLRESALAARGPTLTVVLSIDPQALDDHRLDDDDAAPLAGPEAFRLELSPGRLAITGRTRTGVLRGIATACLLLARARSGATGDLPALVVHDAPRLAVRSAMVHDSRPMAALRSSIDLAFRLRLNHMLIAVDAFGHGATPFPFARVDIGQAGRTKQEWIDAFAYARALGIEPIPYLASWGRVQYITHKDAYRRFEVPPGRTAKPGYRNLDVANPEAVRLMLDMQQELIDALRPSGLCIGFDELIFGDMVTSEAARALGWKPSDWVIAAYTANHSFLKRQGVRMYLWADMFDPDMNGHRLDLSGRELLARLPLDSTTFLDWKYEGRYDRMSDYPSLGFLRDAGAEVMGCAWYYPNNIASMAGSVRRYGALGLCATSWWKTDPAVLTTELRRGLALSSWAGWSPDAAHLATLSQVPDAPVAYALPRTDANLGPPCAHARSLTPAGALAGEEDLVRLMGLPPGSRLDFLARPLRTVRGLTPIPFSAGGRPAALLAGGDAGSVPVGGLVRALTFVHAAGHLPIVAGGGRAMVENERRFAGRLAGEYVVRYEDGGEERIPLALRREIGAVNDTALGRAQDPCIFATVGGRHFVGIASYTWPNPHPSRPVREVGLAAAQNTVSMLFAVVQE